MTAFQRKMLDFKSYQDHPELLVRNYLLSDPLMPYTSIIAGILACKLLYGLTQLISTFYFRSYNGLTKIEKIDWNNRGISMIHAIFISIMSLYFVFWSNLFSHHDSVGPISLRNSFLSTFSLGMSVGYFIADLGMICWLYHSLGGVEYIVHHSLSGTAVAYSMFTGEGQLYTFMVLISEVTTPVINMRWYLDMAGLKISTAYLINGVLIVISWLVARILWFAFIFYYIYLHCNQIMRMHAMGYVLVFTVPVALAVMNLMWFGKILKGLKKTIANRQQRGL